MQHRKRVIQLQATPDSSNYYAEEWETYRDKVTHTERYRDGTHVVFKMTTTTTTPKSELLRGGAKQCITETQTVTWPAIMEFSRLASDFTICQNAKPSTATYNSEHMESICQDLWPHILLPLSKLHAWRATATHLRKDLNGVVDVFGEYMHISVSAGNIGHTNFAEIKRKYRANGASKQVAAELLANYVAKYIKNIKNFYIRKDIPAWDLRCEVHLSDWLLFRDDADYIDTPYIDEVREELCMAVAEDMERIGFIITDKPDLSRWSRQRRIARYKTNVNKFNWEDIE